MLLLILCRSLEYWVEVHANHYVEPDRNDCDESNADDRAQPENVHHLVRSQLRHNLPALRERLDDMTGTDVSPETFSTLLHWINEEELLVKELDHVSMPRILREEEPEHLSYESDDKEEEDDHDDREHPRGYWKLDPFGRVYVRLINLYRFAIDYDLVALRNHVMLEWQTWSEAKGRVPCATAVRHLLSKVAITSHFCQYVIFQWSIDQSWDNVAEARDMNLPSRFLVEVLTMVMRQSQEENDRSCYEDWCKFHEHETCMEKIECEKIWSIEDESDDSGIKIERKDKSSTGTNADDDDGDSASSDYDFVSEGDSGFSAYDFNDEGERDSLSGINCEDKDEDQSDSASGDYDFHDEDEHDSASGINSEKKGEDRNDNDPLASMSHGPLEVQD